MSKLILVAALVLLGGSIAHPSPTRQCSITNCDAVALAQLCPHFPPNPGTTWKRCWRVRHGFICRITVTPPKGVR